MTFGTKLPPLGHPDRLPGAMIEAVTEYDWADLPDYLQDIMRNACREFERWADTDTRTVVGELANELEA